MRKEVTYPALNVPCNRLLTYFLIKLIKLYFSFGELLHNKIQNKAMLNQLMLKLVAGLQWGLSLAWQYKSEGNSGEAWAWAVLSVTTTGL